LTFRESRRGDLLDLDRQVDHRGGEIVHELSIHEVTVTLASGFPSG
jgi:hypothetical protein